MYKNVYKLEPGRYVSIDINRQRHSINTYWNLEIVPCGDNLEQAKTIIYDLTNQSIKEQMMSDVPLGFFLSGGLDSSTVVALAAKNNARVNTFSIGFHGSTNNETHYAKMVADQYQKVHKMDLLDLAETQSMYENIKNWYDEPFGDTSCYPSFLVSRLAKQEATVVLTGDGGDEVFGGYSWYKKFEKYSKRLKIPYTAVPRKLIMQLKKGNGLNGKVGRYLENNFFASELELYACLMGGMLRHEKIKYRLKWYIPEDYDDYWYFRKFYRKDLDVITRLQFLDFHTYLPDDILTKVDRVSMAVSLECRVPLLYTPLIEYVFSLPVEIRLKNGILKGVMKETFGDILPGDILNRDKKGFNIPFRQWRSALFGSNYYWQEVLLKDLYGIDK